MRKIQASLSLAILFIVGNFVTSAQTGVIPTGSDTACLTGVSLFQKLYGSTKDDLGEWLAPAADSGYVLAGQTRSFGSGSTDGFLMKVNKKGNRVWSKVIGGAGEDLIYGIKKTTDNGFIAVGQTKSYGNAAGDAWLGKVDAAGNIQWSRKYGNGNFEGENAFEVVELSDGGYAFCGAHRYAPGSTGSFVVRTDNLGNPIWSKEYDHGGSDEAWGLMEDGNSLVVVGFYRAPDLYDGYVMKLDKSNGLVQWKRTYDAENSRHLLMAKIRTTGSGYQVFSLIMDDFAGTNQEHVIWNLNTDGTVQNVRKTRLSGVHTTGFGWWPQTDGGFMSVNGDNTNASDPIFTKVNADGSISWSKKYIRNGRQGIRAVVASPEGGYAALGTNNYYGTTADSTDIYFVRIDSEGNAGNCSGANTSEITVTFPIYTSSAISISATDVGLSPTAITAVNSSFVPGTTTICYDCKQPVIFTPADQNCTNGTAFYQRVYGGNKDDMGEWVELAADSGFVVTGFTRSFGNGGLDGLLIKVNKKGNTMWSKALGGTGDDVLYTIRRTSDNGFIAVGQTKSFGNSAGDAWLVKMDATGNIQWSKKYGNGNPSGNNAFEVVQLSDGGYAFNGAHQQGAGVSESWIVRTDNQGNILWSKTYGFSGSDEAWGLTEDGNWLMVVGFYRNPSFYDGYVMKLDKTTGAVQWIRTYDVEVNRHIMMAKIRVINSGYQVFSLVSDDFAGTNQQQCVWNLGPDGSVQTVRKLGIPGVQTSSYGFHSLADGGFIVANGENTNNSDLFFSQVNANGTTAWSKKYPRPGRQTIRGGITKSPEGGYVASGVNNTPGAAIDSNDLYLIRIDSLGNSGTCSGANTADVIVLTPSFTSSIISVSPVNVALGSTSMTPVITTVTPLASSFCFYCQPKPTGSARMESLRTAPILKIYPNPVAGGLVNLAIDAAYDDRAIISIVDLQGNVIALLGAKDVRTGNNLFSIELPHRLQNYSTYYIQVRFTDYIVSTQVFVIN